MSARFIVADVFDGLAQLDDASVDLVVTSPPFLALRSYLPANHPDKAKEIGQEANPAEFLDVLLRVTAELRRVLAPHGSICVELGDTYAGTGGAGGDWSDSEMTTKARVPGGSNGGPPRRPSLDGWPLAKSKTLIPELYRVALAYGINPLTGQESPAGRWRVRNVVTWCRPNPPVGALGDKWRPATSDVIVACVSDRRYWDDIATRRAADPANKRPSELKREGINGRTDQVMNPLGADGQRIIANSHGAPLLDWHSPLAAAIDRAAAEAFAVGRHTTEPLFGETKNEVKETIGRRTLRELVEQGAIDPGDVLYVPPGGYKGSHYAVMSDDLVVPLVQAMLPPKVCRTCGEPQRRTWTDLDKADAIWTCCGCGPNCVVYDFPEPHGICYDDHWRPPVILDPFAGSGTTLAVALGHNPDALAIGIDLDERNELLARDRVGPLLWVTEGSR